MTNPLDRVGWPVRTARLTIRPAQASDLGATWQYRRLPEVSHWMTSAPTTIDDYGTIFEDPDRLARTQLMELDGDVIGDLMIAVGNAWAQTEVADRAEAVQAEVGWCLDPWYGGQGYATEGAAALLRICFEDLGLRRVTAGCFAENVASWRLMERLGMRREIHQVQQSLHRTEGWLDEYGYALLADEWVATTSRRSSGSRRVSP
jgi:RimJ/RimL family protein N-acetyltransferase